MSKLQYADVPQPSESTLKGMVEKVLNSGLIEHAGAFGNMINDRINNPSSQLGGLGSRGGSGNQNMSYEQALEKSKEVVKNDDFRKLAKSTVTNPVVSQGLTSLGTGNVNGTVTGALATSKVLEVLGLKQQSELEKSGASGHNRRNTTIKLSDLKPEQQKIYLDYLNKNGIKYNKSKSSTQKESYISEERRSSILKDLKKPVVIPETKQKSYKVSPGKRLNQKTNFQGMDKLIGDTKLQKTFKKPQDIWSQDWQGYNAKLSQNKKNEVLELIGDGKHAFDYMLTDSRAKNAEEMEKFWGLHPDLYSYNFDGKKYKATRKEQVKGDYVVFLVDETGEKSSMLQSRLNEKMAEEEEKEMLDEYNKLNPKNEPIPYEKDPLFKKVAKRLKNEIDYPDKPSPKGYPDKPPAKQVDGWHPDYGKRYKYDKLDPVSAVAMRNAPTGNPEIDVNVEKAAKKSK